MMETDKKHLCNDGLNSNCSTPQKEEPVKNVGWTWLLALAGISTTIGSAIPIGWTIGVLNTPTRLIQLWMNESIYERYETVVTDTHMQLIWSAVVSIFLVGGMLGSFTGAWLACKIGRKGALMVAALLFIGTSGMFVIARPLSSLELMFIARFIAGLGSGLAMSVMPMYLSEIAPIELRGAVGVLCPLGVTSGVVIAQILGLPGVLGTEASWHYLVGLYGLLSLVCGAAFPLLPESPKYLYLIRGSKQQALRELSRLRQLPEEFVCCELDESGESDGVSWSFARVLGCRELWLNLALVCAYNLGQQASGINAVFYYSVSIFKQAGLSEENAQLANLAAGSINLLVSLIMIPIINLFPRRAMSITSCSLATAFLVLLSFSITFMNSVPWLSYVSIFAVLAYVVSYGLALGPLPYFLGTELFDMGPRPIGMSLGTAANWIGNLSIGLFFPTMQSVMGAYSFLVFATVTALLTIFIKICLPETNVIVLAKRRRRNSIPPMEKI